GRLRDPVNEKSPTGSAKPAPPGDSSFDPTWYHTSTATSGLERSRCRITGGAFSRTNVSNGIVSSGGTGKPASLHESAPVRSANRRRRSTRAGLVALLGAIAWAGQAFANGALPASYGILPLAE